MIVPKYMVKEEVIVYDNINTDFQYADMYINEINAPAVISLLLEEETSLGELSAEKYAYLSKAYVFVKDDEKALEYAQKSVKKDIGYVYGHVRLAFTYARMAKKELTLQYVNNADRLNNDENMYINAFLAILYKYCDNELRAEELIEVLKKHYVNNGEYNYYMGFIYSQEEPQKAVEYFEKAEILGFKDKFNLWNNLAENYFEIDNYEKAEEYANKCFNTGVTARLLEIKSDCMKQKEDYTSAVKYLRQEYKLCKDADDKVRTLALMIYNYSEMNQYKRADRLGRFAVKYFKPDYTLYYVIASSYESQEKYRDALYYYREILENKLSDNASTYSSLSYCYSEIGDDDSALKYVEMAIQKDPYDSYSHYRKGRILVNIKDYEEAIKSFERSLDYDKTDVDSFQWISYCYSMLKDFEKSLEYANRAILINKDDCYSYFRKAWAYQEMSRYTEAINFYKECIRCNDKYVDAYLNISYVYSKLGDNKRSLVYANKALLINQEYSYAHYRKAWALQESGRLEEAYDGYSKAIELDPSDIYNYLGIACIALNNQDNSDALTYANKAIFIDRNCGGAYYYKSIALSNMGKIKEAEAAYTKALQLGYPVP